MSALRACGVPSRHHLISLGAPEPRRRCRPRFEPCAQRALPAGRPRACRRARRWCRPGAESPRRFAPEPAGRAPCVTARATTASTSCDDGARRSIADVSDPSGFVSAVGEAFGRNRQAGSCDPRPASRIRQGRRTTSERSNDAIARCDRVGQRAIARRHVVERAVRLDVATGARPRTPRSPPARRSDRARDRRPRSASSGSRGVQSRRGPRTPGCAPQATPCRTASRSVARMTAVSPACAPHAMFAEVMCGMIAASAPSSQRPNDSPMSQLRSTRMPSGIRARACGGAGHGRGSGSGLGG